jgi:aminopeptidase
MKMNEAQQRYAQLALRIGTNIQKDQTLYIQADHTAAPFVRALVAHAYDFGASHVHVDWNDEWLRRVYVERAPIGSFEKDAQHRARTYDDMVRSGAAIMHVTTTFPKLMEGLDDEKIGNITRVYGHAFVSFREAIMRNRVAWTVVAVPNEQWATTVFPELHHADAVDALWSALLDISRATQTDAIGAWRTHVQQLNIRKNWLNALQLKSLQYTAPGTQLTITLADGHTWVSGDGKSASGVPFVANIPTEELFTMPQKTGVHGTVRSTKPLYYNGTIVEGLSLAFEEGRVVSFDAVRGKNTIAHLLDQDEGARYLGEVALVPHDSPISNTGLVFYNTLIDENAAHHVALGNAYASCIDGGEQMDRASLATRGANESIVHVDFMIGSADMDIDGITNDGRTIPLFRKGAWVHPIEHIAGL